MPREESVHGRAAGATSATSLELFWVEVGEFGDDEAAVLADEAVVEVDFAAADFGGLHEDDVPVDGGVVAVVGFLVGLAGGEVDGAGDLFVEENVLHGLRHVGVETDRELADVAGAFVGVEELGEPFGVGAGGLYDAAVLEEE